MREGSLIVPFLRRRGANLCHPTYHVSPTFPPELVCILVYWNNSLLRTNKHTLNVQIHDFLERTLGVLVELFAPGRAGVGEQDVDVVGVLGDFGDEALDFACFGDVRGDRDGFAFRVGQGVERCDGFFAGFGFARGDEDFAAAGLGEAVGGGNG